MTVLSFERIPLGDYAERSGLRTSYALGCEIRRSTRSRVDEARQILIVYNYGDNYGRSCESILTLYQPSLIPLSLARDNEAAIMRRDPATSQPAIGAVSPRINVHIRSGRRKKLKCSLA